ncbi:hypothetical protein H0H92_002452 [Tricholoma furcatifolium]|nr:hypothetical protein H0H92_002452 [Tricholoma furcatifolium]
MAEVQIGGQLAFAKSENVRISLKHLADINDPTLTPLVQAFDSKVGTLFPNQKIIPRHTPQRHQAESSAFPRHTLTASAIDPRQPVPHTPAPTPLWSGGSASTPAWDPSS